MSLNKQKCDPELGLKVHKHLVQLGLETPRNDIDFSVKQKISIIQANFCEIMTALGMDLNDDSLKDTPMRVAKMYVTEIFYGLDYETFPKCTAIDNTFNADEMIVERSINVKTTCEHHLIVIDGLATVGYIPARKILGLSKMNRLVEYFSKRPQVQERLTMQIHAAMCFILDTPHVAVMIDAKHYCVASRGIEDTGSSTTTSKLSGAFKDPKEGARAEFLAIARSR